MKYNTALLIYALATINFIGCNIYYACQIIRALHDREPDNMNHEILFVLTGAMALIGSLLIIIEIFNQ
jgi:hypothetical protein